MQVKYTVHTRTSASGMKKETSVVREHEEFMWLHSVLDENENYAGFIVSPLYNLVVTKISQLSSTKYLTNLNTLTAAWPILGHAFLIM